MLRYKVYQIVDSSGDTRLIEDVNFYWYDTMDEAVEDIKNKGYSYVKYTVLPVLYIS